MKSANSSTKRNICLVTSLGLSLDMIYNTLKKNALHKYVISSSADISGHDI
jgi:hypothetical protein